MISFYYYNYFHYYYDYFNKPNLVVQARDLNRDIKVLKSSLMCEKRKLYPYFNCLLDNKEAKPMRSNPLHANHLYTGSVLIRFCSDLDGRIDHSN